MRENVKVVYSQKMAVGFLLLPCYFGGADCGKSKKHLILFLLPCVCGFPPTPHTPTHTAKTIALNRREAKKCLLCRSFLTPKQTFLDFAPLFFLDYQRHVKILC